MANAPAIPNFTPGFREVDGSDLQALSTALQALVGQGRAPVNQSAANLNLTGLLFESAADGLAAHAGGGQAQALPLTAEVNRIATAATAGDSVMLPPSAPGLTIFLINASLNPMQVFGAGTDAIDGQPAATGVTQMQGSSVIYTCTTAGAWATNGIGTGYVGSLPTVSSTNGIVATPAGTQASAAALQTVINRVTTVATAGDAVKLPPAAPGLQITVSNAGAASMNVFPGVGDAINGAAVNAAYALPAGKTASFTSAVVGQWHAVLSA